VIRGQSLRVFLIKTYDSMPSYNDVGEDDFIFQVSFFYDRFESPGYASLCTLCNI
jgi:hypothetical protein